MLSAAQIRFLPAFLQDIDDHQRHLRRRAPAVNMFVTVATDMISATADCEIGKIGIVLTGYLEWWRARRPARGALPWTTGTSYCHARGTFLRRRAGTLLLRR